MSIFPTNPPADLLTLTTSLLTAHASNPNTSLTTEGLADGLERLYSVMHRLQQGNVDHNASPRGTKLPAPRPAVSLPAPEVAPAPAAPAPAPVAREAAKPAVEKVHAQPAPAPVESRDREIWPNATDEQRAKFRALMREHNIQTDLSGRPVPRRRIEDMISEDGFEVADPIQGEYFKMLKRHLNVAYGLTHEDVLIMFGLTAEQLPRTGPAYSDSKRMQAHAAGLGKNNAGGRRKKAANG